MMTAVVGSPRAKDKVVVITGGAKGIGRAASQVFADEGASVIVADIDRSVGEVAAARLTAEGATAVFIETDVTNRQSCETTVGEILDRFGRIDVLVSNAGIYPLVFLDEMTEDDWDRIFAINVKGMFFMVAAVLPSMRTRRRGRIVLTSSVVGPITGNFGTAHYGASKAAMLGFMRSVALEVAQEGVTINAVLPGHIETEGSKARMSKEEAVKVALTVPVKRLGDPREIGYAMLFLASDEAGYITGQTIVVDGGLTLPTYRS